MDVTRLFIGVKEWGLMNSEVRGSRDEWAGKGNVLRSGIFGLDEAGRRDGAWCRNGPD